MADQVQAMLENHFAAAKCRAAFLDRRGKKEEAKNDSAGWDDVGFYGTVKAMQPTPRGRRPKAAG